MADMATILLSPSQLAEAREWLVDLEFAETSLMDVEERREYFAERSDAAIERAIVRHCDGGIAGFIQATCIGCDVRFEGDVRVVRAIVGCPAHS